MAAVAKRTVTIDVVSDTICPWCFVGKRRLDAALRVARAQHPDVAFEVKWRPFFLDPTLPRGGVDKTAHYERKFGSERMQAMLPYMARVGAAEAPPIAFDYGGRISNTLDSHRLLELALHRGGAALQDRLVEELFARYFTRRGDLGDHALLTDAAVAAGMDAAEVTAFLAGDGLAADVKREVAAWAARYRITGVPFFVLDGGRLTLSGAQDVATFADALDDVASRPAASRT